MSSHPPRIDYRSKEKPTDAETQRWSHERREEERRRIEQGYERTSDLLDPAARERRDTYTHAAKELARRVNESGGASAAGRELRVLESTANAHYDQAGAPLESGPEQTGVSLQLNGHVVEAAQRQSVGANAHPAMREQARTNKYRLTAGLVVGSLSGTIIGAGTTALTVFLVGLFKASHPDPEPGPEPGPDYDPTMRKILNEWRALTEPEFWAAVINWLDEEKRSPAMQLDSISFLRSIAEWKGTYTDKFILDTVNSLLQEWERAGVNENGWLTNEKETARNVALYESVRDLKDDAPNPGELPRFWKLRILEFVLALIVTPVRLVDNQNDQNDQKNTADRFTTIGEWNEVVGPNELYGKVHFATKGTEGRIARFSVDPLSPGDYVVSTTWRPGPENATDAEYRILDKVDGSLLVAVTINQRPLPDDFDDFGSTWKRLATVHIEEKKLVVELSDSKTGDVFADAVHVKRTVQLPPNAPDD